MPNVEQSTLIDNDWLRDIDFADIELSKRYSPVRELELSYEAVLSEYFGADIYLADDTLQDTGSFKIRGAYMGVRNLDYWQRGKGLETASAGNFAAGVAQSCNILDIDAVIWVPNGTPVNKIENIRKFGNSSLEIVEEGDDFAETEEIAKASSEKNERLYLSPFDNRPVITGQASVAKEIVRKLPKDNQIDHFIAAVGGGGLITGTSMVVKSTYPEARIIGVEPEGAASLTLARQLGKVASLEGPIDNFVDGAAVRQIGELAFKYGNPLIDRVIVMPNIKTRQATTYLWEQRDKPKRVELAAAMALAGLFEIAQTDSIENKTVVVTLSGRLLSQERYDREVRVASHQRLHMSR